MGTSMTSDHHVTIIPGIWVVGRNWRSTIWFLFKSGEPSFYTETRRWCKLPYSTLVHRWSDLKAWMFIAFPTFVTWGTHIPNPHSHVDAFGRYKTMPPAGIEQCPRRRYTYWRMHPLVSRSMRSFTHSTILLFVPASIIPVSLSKEKVPSQGSSIARWMLLEP